MIVCLSLFLWTGCGEQEKPEGLLSEEEMVNVLIDIHITEGIASAIPVSYDSSGVLYSLMEKEVFIKHQVEDTVFKESLRYYLQFPATMDKMYAQVLDSLASKENFGVKKDVGEPF